MKITIDNQSNLTNLECFNKVNEFLTDYEIMTETLLTKSNAITFGEYACMFKVNKNSYDFSFTNLNNEEETKDVEN